MYFFWKQVSGWKNPKTQPSRSRVDSKYAYFPKRWRHRPSPRRLITTTTTTMADYCLCSCFLQITRLVVECESQQQFDLIIGPYKRSRFSCTSTFSSSSYYFVILLLLSVCKQRASFTRMLCLVFSVFGEFRMPPRGPGYELQRFESFSVDPCGRKYSWNNAEEDGGKKTKIVSARVDSVWPTHASKNAVASDPQHLWISSEWLHLKCILNAHVYRTRRCPHSERVLLAAVT